MGNAAREFSETISKLGHTCTLCVQDRPLVALRLRPTLITLQTTLLTPIRICLKTGIPLCKKRCPRLKVNGICQGRPLGDSYFAL